MTDAEINHLRRLLGWVRCEIGQSPEEMAAMWKDLLPKIGPVSEEGAQRLRESAVASMNVPHYIRAAVKTLGRLTEEMHGTTLDGEATENPLVPSDAAAHQ